MQWEDERNNHGLGESLSEVFCAFYVLCSTLLHLQPLRFHCFGGEAVRHEREISKVKTGFFSERDECKPLLLGRSLAGNLVKPLMSLYGAEWRERGYGLRTAATLTLVVRRSTNLSARSHPLS
jgi:hypothetical protein